MFGGLSHLYKKRVAFGIGFEDEFMQITILRWK